MGIELPQFLVHQEGSVVFTALVPSECSVHVPSILGQTMSIFKGVPFHTQPYL